MKANIKRRLAVIEMSKTDWISQLDTVDYIFRVEDYSEQWTEVWHDQTITVLRNEGTGEIRGVYSERRSDDEIEASGGNLAYL